MLFDVLCTCLHFPQIPYNQQFFEEKAAAGPTLLAGQLSVYTEKNPTASFSFQPYIALPYIMSNLTLWCYENVRESSVISAAPAYIVTGARLVEVRRVVLN